MTTPSIVGAGETATLLQNRLAGLCEELARMSAGLAAPFYADCVNG